MSRLRSAEKLAAVGVILLLVSLLALHWYGPVLHGPAGWWSYPPQHILKLTSLTGWRAIPTLRWFGLVTVVLGAGLVLAQAVDRGPALPVTLDLIALLIAGLTTILLAIRLATTTAPLRFGAVVGLFGAGLITFGAFRAMRTEAGWTPGEDRPVELVALADGP